MPWLLLIIKHILPISELYSSFRRTDLTTGDILVASVGVHGLCFGHQDGRSRNNSVVPSRFRDESI